MNTPKTENFWRNKEYEMMNEDHKIGAWSDFARSLEADNRRLRIGNMALMAIIISVVVFILFL